MEYLTHHLIQSSQSRYPEKIALVDGQERVTYDRLWKEVSSLGEGLQSLGVQRLDRVGIYLEPSIPQVVSIFGVSKAGGTFVPINPLLMPNQVMHIANDCGMRGLITTAGKLEAVMPILNQMPSLDFVVVVSGEGGAGDIDPTGSLR